MRHDLVVAKEKRTQRELWLRISPWLLPGLALGWLALLATFIHSVASVLTAWGATVCVALLLLRRRHGMLPRGQQETVGDSSRMTESERTPKLPAGSHQSAETTKAVSVSESGHADLASSTFLHERSSTNDQPEPVSDPTVCGPGAAGSATSAGIVSQFQILTAAEAASVLRVDIKLVTAAIDNGELPGNRIGQHWRMDQALLARWLHGKYEEPSRSVDKDLPESGPNSS